MARASQQASLADAQPRVAERQTDRFATAMKEIEPVLTELELDTNPFTRAIQLAAAIKRLREIISYELVAGDLMELYNCGLGFRCDRPSSKHAEPYPVAVVRDCVIEALLQGAMPVDNEFNIISGRAYLTQEFFWRKVSRWPGLEDLRLSPGVPQVFNGGALVPYVCTWRVAGEEFRVERLKYEDRDERIPVRINEGMGSDAILGKAKRKILAQVYDVLCGRPVGSARDGEVEAPLLDAVIQGAGDSKPAAFQEPRRKTAASASSEQSSPLSPISDAQRSYLLSQVVRCGWTAKEFSAYLAQEFGVETPEQIRGDWVPQIEAEIKRRGGAGQ